MTASGQSWCTRPAMNVPWPATGSSGPVRGETDTPPISGSSYGYSVGGSVDSG
ncbi:Uncharacterised protein [Mycobacteroides abscessus]|nr:Uncharacterised protein [Mycobacteroides abscessus]